MSDLRGQLVFKVQSDQQVLKVPLEQLEVLEQLEQSVSSVPQDLRGLLVPQVQLG
jgi:hypothetical protein